MIERFRKNYSLSVWLIRLVFYISFIFCNWFTLESAFVFLGISGTGILPYSFWLIAAAGLISAVLAEILIKLLLRFIIYLSRIVSLPRNEYANLFLLYMIPRNVIMGALNLTFYLTPVVITWGSILFEIVVTTPFLYLFFAQTKKLYFNDKSSPYYFKVFSIVYLIYFGAVLLTLIWGLI